MDSNLGKQHGFLGPCNDRCRVAAIAETTLAGETVGDFLGDPGSDEGNRGSGMPDLIGKNHRNAEIGGHLAGNCTRKRTDMAKEPMLSAALPACEIGPGGRDDREVDAIAVVVPGAPKDHVGTDRESDASERRIGDDGVSTRPEAEPLPEDKIALAVDMDAAVR